MSLRAMRQALADLFPDAEWVRLGSAWHFRESPNAQIVRAVASGWTERDDEWSAAAGGLYTQVASELKPEQMRELVQNRSVRVPWGKLSPASQSMLRTKAELDYAIDDASGIPRSLQPDPNQMSQRSVEFLRRPGGGIKARMLGRTADGALTVGP